MKYKVWHDKDPSFMKQRDFNGDNFDFVAAVDCEVIDEVFALTNHITHDWTTNEGVTTADGRNGHNTRSTSVGDIVIDGDGTAFYVAAWGWDKVQV